jgi:hypothetical protein
MKHSDAIGQRLEEQSWMVEVVGCCLSLHTSCLIPHTSPPEKAYG